MFITKMGKLINTSKTAEDRYRKVTKKSNRKGMEKRKMQHHTTFFIYNVKVFFTFRYMHHINGNILDQQKRIFKIPNFQTNNRLGWSGVLELKIHELHDRNNIVTLSGIAGKINPESFNIEYI